MCGIAGGIALVPGTRPDVDRVREMSRRIAHRGPDGDGIWIAPSGRACLAHRRLSIIDLATGQQPMLAEGGTAGIVFNGEIYNYRELRDRLRDEGARFTTGSDTEVLLVALQRHGAAALDDLRGMFSFVYWDDVRGRLLVARDRVGKKPLFYVVDDGVMYFASSLNALRETSRSAWELDPEAGDLYLSLGYIPAPRTIYRGVYKLPAGTAGALEPGDHRLRVASYWDLAEQDEPFTGSYEDALVRLEELLDTAVTLRLRSDVPLGIFLSGGIDSSLVTALAARKERGIATFSIGFDDADPGQDESAFAAQVAAHLGTDHHTFRVRPDLFELLPQLVWHFGEPYADPSALPTWVLAQHTRQHVTVALGGDGGDEGFAGYHWYQTSANLRRLSRRVPRPAAAAAAWALSDVARLTPAAPGVRRVGQLQRGLGMLALPGDADRFASLRSFVGPAEARLLYHGPLAETRRAGTSSAHRLLREAGERCRGSALRRHRYTDILTYLADDLLPKVDVATMAHGLEARAPLLDHEVLRFALSLPDGFLVGPDGGKRILRDLLYRLVPRSLFERPKQGFSVPLRRWFAGGLRARVERLPESEALASLGWIRPEGIRRLVDEQLSGYRDNTQRLFSLVVLDEWLARR